MSATGRLSGQIFAHTPLAYLGEAHRTPLPLLPNRRPQPPPEPLFKTFQHRRRFAFAEISDPAAQIRRQFFRHSLHADTSRPARQFPNPLFEPVHRFRRDSPLWYACVRKAETQKLSNPWSRHRTLLLVDLELKLCRQESRDASHHPFPRSSAANVNIAIVRIPGKAQTAPLQLPVQLVEY